MRVIVEPAGVGMQHRSGTGGALQLLVVSAEGAHRLPTAAHQQVVNQTLVRKRQHPELGRQRERDQKIPGRHLLLELAFEPLLTLMVLAVRAVAVAAGVRHQLLMIAAAALHLHLGAGLGAAALDGGQCLQVRCAQAFTVLRPQVFLERVNDAGEPDHLTCPPLTFPQVMAKPSISTLMRSIA